MTEFFGYTSHTTIIDDPEQPEIDPEALRMARERMGVNAEVAMRSALFGKCMTSTNVIEGAGERKVSYDDLIAQVEAMKARIKPSVRFMESIAAVSLEPKIQETRQPRKPRVLKKLRKRQRLVPCAYMVSNSAFFMNDSSGEVCLIHPDLMGKIKDAT